MNKTKNTSEEQPLPNAADIQPTDNQWGKKSSDHHGYKDDAERRAKRGLEDWELLDGMPQSQKPVPKWFFAVIAAVLLIAIGLSFPFWGNRPGYERDWINWGFAIALAYLAVFGTFVYYMVMHGSHHAGDIEQEETDSPKKKRTKTPPKS